MDVDLGPQYREFRVEIREWIERNAPPGLAELAPWGWAMVAGGNRGARVARATSDPLYQRWSERLAAAHMICAQWPTQFGGLGWDSVRVAIFNEELRRAGVPAVRRGMGETLAGPAIIVHGTPEQRAYFLPRIVAGTDVYCQGIRSPTTAPISERLRRGESSTETKL